MDWYSRKVLSWKVSNTLDTAFCVEALEEAVHRYGAAEIFNTDQGAQYTSRDFISNLKAHQIQLSMDGRGRWVDNVMIERLWRSLKYECLYLQELTSVNELKSTLRNWFMFYNQERPHTTFAGRRPSEVYSETTSHMPPNVDGKYYRPLSYLSRLFGPYNQDHLWQK